MAVRMLQGKPVSVKYGASLTNVNAFILKGCKLNQKTRAAGLLMLDLAFCHLFVFD
jgi:hypothetical protein